jgi:flagellar basal-body rod protein FlgF
MQNALLIGLSRQMALAHQLDIVANNIANIDSTGFKADSTSFSEYLMPGASDGEFSTGKDRKLSFVQDNASWTDMSPGAMQRTGSPLDVALDGKGYFVVQTSQGPRYTRNGAFAINGTGQLVNGDGDQVMGASGPITFQQTDHDVVISGNGIISVRDGPGAISAQRGQLQVVSFDQQQKLQKDGGSKFMAPSDLTVGPAPPGTRVVQGSIEKSNVRPILEMTRMIEITRNYSDVASILQQVGDMRRNSLQQLSQIQSASS